MTGEVHKLSIQFHALPMELVDLAVLMRDRYQVLVWELDPEKKKILRSLDGVGGQNIAGGFALSMAKIDHSESSVEDAVASDRSLLVVEAGAQTGTTLGESWLWMRTPDASAVKRWRSMLRSFISSLFKGMIATNINTGISAVYPAGRFTLGAARRSTEGVRLLPAAGTVVLSVPPEWTAP